MRLEKYTLARSEIFSVHRTLFFKNKLSCKMYQKNKNSCYLSVFCKSTEVRKVV